MKILINVQLAENLVSYNYRVRLKAEQTLRSMLTVQQFSEDNSRRDFEAMAAEKYPGALLLGRHPVFLNYINSNLEKRWKGWLQCDQYRFGHTEEKQ